MLLLIFLIGNMFHTQEYTLQNKTLIQYYEKINNAEMHIVNNALDSAFTEYKSAFRIHKQPPAIDLYNSMQVALQLRKSKFAKEKFNTLNCLHYQFDDEFIKRNNFKQPKRKCRNDLDAAYKAKLDYLFIIDQKYRKLSNGDYNKYRSEITHYDSIASVRLLDLVNNKGFPNEYDIGLSSASSSFKQNFYMIILHQLKRSSNKSQVVNFSDSMVNALNNGKITPANAAYLIDLNNGTTDYELHLFHIQGVIKVDSAINRRNMDYDKIDFYLSKAIHPEHQNERIRNLIRQTNLNRKRIGLDSLEDMLAKSLFHRKNKTYKFETTNVMTHVFTTKEEMEDYIRRMGLIKIAD